MDEVWKTQTEKRIRFLEERLASVEKRQRQQVSASAVAVPDRGPVAPAPDIDLDGAHGNPEIRRDPPRWTGPSFIARRYSDCTPEYLDALADFFEWQMRKDAAEGRITGGGKPTADYKRRDASRARGWAARLRKLKAGGAATKPLSDDDQALLDIADENENLDLEKLDDEIPF